MFQMCHKLDSEGIYLLPHYRHTFQIARAACSVVASALLGGVALTTQPSLADVHSASGPLVCSGWISRERGFGMVGIEDAVRAEDFCPPDSAYLATATPFNRRRPPAFIPIAGTCCPLPRGALIATHTFTRDRCPPGQVATGARQKVDYLGVPEASIDGNSKKHWANRRIQELRCTQINAALFELGPEQPGVAVGWPRSFSTWFHPTTTRPQIPIALRVGVGRLSKYAWNPNFCIGSPPGSVLTGKTSKYCEGLRFSALRPRENNPAQDATEPGRYSNQLAFEDCYAVDSKFIPNPRCVLLRTSPQTSASP